MAPYPPFLVLLSALLLSLSSFTPTLHPIFPYTPPSFRRRLQVLSSLMPLADAAPFPSLPLLACPVPPSLTSLVPGSLYP